MASATSDTALTTFPIRFRMPSTIPLIKSEPHRKALDASPVIKPTARLNPSVTALYTFPIAVRML